MRDEGEEHGGRQSTSHSPHQWASLHKHGRTSTVHECAANAEYTHHHTTRGPAYSRRGSQTKNSPTPPPSFVSPLAVPPRFFFQVEVGAAAGQFTSQDALRKSTGWGLSCLICRPHSEGSCA